MKNTNGGNQMMLTSDLTGRFVTIPSLLDGSEWFFGKAVERLDGELYRFQVFRIAGRVMDVEMVADIDAIGRAACKE